LAEHQNRHAIFKTPNCDIHIQQGLEPSDIIMEAPELHGGGVDNVTKKMAGRGPPEVEEHPHRSRERPGTLTPADRNSRQAARLDQDKRQEADCRGKKKEGKTQEERNWSRSSVNRAQAQQT
jgi:hypothetical protein